MKIYSNDRFVVFLAQRGLSVAGRSVKLSKDHHTAIEEVRNVSHASHA